VFEEFEIDRVREFDAVTLQAGTEQGYGVGPIKK
jgi:hypothetical protein